MSRQLTLAVVAAFALVMMTCGAADAASKCSGGKVKNSGKKAAAKLTCLSKAVGKAVGVDSTCLAKAEVKFSKAFAKAQSKTPNDCLTTGDAAVIEGKVDQLVDDIDNLVADNNGGTASACDAAKTKAAGKKTAAKLTCVSKAVAKAPPVDSTCLAKAEVKFSSAVAKAESKAASKSLPCTATGDASAYESLIDTAVSDIETELTPTTTTTSTTTTTTTTTTTSTTTTTCPAPTTIEVKGSLIATKGRFNYCSQIGLPAANNCCNTFFPPSHACTIAELQGAPASDLACLKDTDNNTVTSLWAIDPLRPALDQCVADPPPNRWEYNTAHTSSRGDFVMLNNATGALGSVQPGEVCTGSGPSHWVACCQ